MNDSDIFRQVGKYSNFRACAYREQKMEENKRDKKKRKESAHVLAKEERVHKISLFLRSIDDAGPSSINQSQRGVSSEAKMPGGAALEVRPSADEDEMDKNVRHAPYLAAASAEEEEEERI